MDLYNIQYSQFVFKHPYNLQKQPISYIPENRAVFFRGISLESGSDRFSFSRSTKIEQQSQFDYFQQITITSF